MGHCQRWPRLLPSPTHGRLERSPGAYQRWTCPRSEIESQSYPRQTLHLEIKDQIYLWTSNPKTLRPPSLPQNEPEQCPLDKANVQRSSFIGHFSGKIANAIQLQDSDFPRICFVFLHEESVEQKNSFFIRRF